MKIVKNITTKKQKKNYHFDVQSAVSNFLKQKSKIEVFNLIVEAIVRLLKSRLIQGVGKIQKHKFVKLT